VAAHGRGSVSFKAWAFECCSLSGRAGSLVETAKEWGGWGLNFGKDAVKKAVNETKKVKHTLSVTSAQLTLAHSATHARTHTAHAHMCAHAHTRAHLTTRAQPPPLLALTVCVYTGTHTRRTHTNNRTHHACRHEHTHKHASAHTTPDTDCRSFRVEYEGAGGGRVQGRHHRTNVGRPSNSRVTGTAFGNAVATRCVGCAGSLR
jgi:hypothetical protein